jgi:hypothetical protein
MRVEWRRGFFRLWVLLTAIWVGLTFYLQRPDLELRRDESVVLIPYGNISFQFPADVDEGVVARAIDNWAKSENALSKKIRDQVPLTEFTDDDLKKYNERLHGRDHLEQWETNDLVLVGEELAKKSMTNRPQSLRVFITHYSAWTIGPPLLLLLFGFIVTWVIKGFTPQAREV